MRSIAFALFLSGCGLFPDLDGLSSDAGENADAKTPTKDAASDVVVLPDANFDAPAVTYTRTITIHDNTSQGLPKGYTIGVAFPDSELQAAITAGKMRSDMIDLRVRGTAGERDRLVDALDMSLSGTRVVWFSLASPISANATDTTYAITYGVPNASSPPANGTNVFDFYDDFSGTSIHPQWMTQGTVNIGGGMVTLPHGGLGALTTLSQSPTSTAEWRAKITDPSSSPDNNTGFYYWIGYQHTGDFDASDPWVVWIARAAGSVGGEDKADGCLADCAGSTTTQSKAFRYYAIERQPTQTIFSIDLAANYTTPATNDQALSPMIRNYLQTSDLVVDWYRSRARVYPEPTVTLGPEQP